MGEDTEAILRRAFEGDAEALNRLFQVHRDRLIRFVRMRLDPRLQRRVDASDVVQEASLDAFQRFAKYTKEKERMPFFLWLRFLTGQKVLELHRRHLGAQRRDVRREVRLHRGPWPEATTTLLANRLLGKATAPDRAAERAELLVQLERALDAMEPLDREILALRHFEQLTNAEAAQELGIGAPAASKRYVRALRKLKGVLPGTGEPS